MNQTSKLSLLSPERLALIDTLLREEGIESPVAQVTANEHVSIKPISRNGSLPLSHAQERLWFLDQLSPSDPVYNMSAGIRLAGPLDVGALEKALQEIVRRHETLRTGFCTVEGRPVAVISPQVELALQRLDLRAVPEDVRESEADQHAIIESRRSFDLAGPPLLRALLLLLSENENILLLTMHHIISDGWSLEVLFRELGALYDAYSMRQESPLPELAIQYVDYAAWEQESLAGERLERQLSYWKDQLGGRLPIVELPAYQPRPVLRSHWGDKLVFDLGPERLRALKQLSAQQGATLFMVLLAAFKVLLYKYTGQIDLIVGTATANRSRVELETLIGLFANTVALRTDLSGDPTFLELLRRVREVTLGAFDHQELPFEKLVEAVQVERDLSHTPLTQVFFVLNNDPMRALTMHKLRVSPLAAEIGTAKFDLALTMVEGPQGLTGVFEYDTDLLEPGYIARMIRNFAVILREVVTRPHQNLSAISLLSKEEHHQLTCEWNQTHVDSPSTSCVQRLFEDQAETAPESVAVAFKDRQLTYGELNRRANRLARRLGTMGITLESRVAVCMDRSVELIVALTGILKAGAAYVPVDPAYPEERVSFILDDSRAALLVTQSHVAPRLRSHPVSNLCIDVADAFGRHSDENLANGVEPFNLGYIVYTSGSTGAPKGIMVQHGSLVNFITAATLEYGLTREDRVLQFASISFDTSLEEVYTCLTSGASLVLRDDSMLGSLSAFVRRCSDWALTVLDLPTAYWHELCGHGPSGAPSMPPSVRLVIIGGETAASERLASWQELAGRRTVLMNTYGPTEATVVTTRCELAGSSADVGDPPIGRPISNVRVYVLDQYAQPVPIGVPGELHIGGRGVARGYLNRAALTAEKFVPDPFGNEPGARLYKSGDLVRYLLDGNLGFLGRIDHQVKIRGFRVELGEIEAALSGHAAVSSSVVVAREDTSGMKRLVAYIVGPVPHTSAATELRGFLRGRLPEYMIPAAYVVLDALPLTPSGKVDRNALPAPDLTRPQMEQGFTAPRTPTEELIAGIWASVLAIDRVGIYDNFFDLGGNSLLMVRVRSSLQSFVDRDIQMVDLFRYPTVSLLAAFLGQVQNEEPSFEISPLRAEQRRRSTSRQREVRKKARGSLGGALDSQR